MQLCNDVKSPIQFFPNIDVNYIFFLKCNINRHPKMQKYKKVAKYVLTQWSKNWEKCNK